MADRLVVAKTRRMVAHEVVAAVGLEAWESDHLRRLSSKSLFELARRVVPGFEPCRNA